MEKPASSRVEGGWWALQPANRTNRGNARSHLLRPPAAAPNLLLLLLSSILGLVGFFYHLRRQAFA